MKKPVQKNKKPNKFGGSIKDRFPKRSEDDMETIVDSIALRHDLSEEFREPLISDLDDSKVNTVNWSEPEDRGEKLAANKDPLIQEDELDSDIPPELSQKKRNKKTPKNLADQFDEERKDSKDV